MNCSKLKIIIVLVMLFVNMRILSQNEFTLTYDDNGNRTNFNLIEFKTSEALMDSLNITSTEPEADFYSDTIDNFAVKIYPNPTNGLLMIEIEGFKSDIDGTISIFNSNGIRIFRKEEIYYMNTISIFDQPAGIYFLKIIINGKGKSEWKIVKS